jgi:hypothetical protein
MTSARDGFASPSLTREAVLSARVSNIHAVEGRLASRQHFRCATKVKLFMTIFELDQAEEALLTHQISDEALEMAAGSETAANYTLFYCTALDLCPGP